MSVIYTYHFLDEYTPTSSVDSSTEPTVTQSGLSPGVIAAIIIILLLIVVLVGAVVIVVFIWWRKRTGEERNECEKGHQNKTY